MSSLSSLLIGAFAIAAGIAIGFGFGRLQDAALRRHTERERAGTLRNGWTLLPGAGGRVALLLVALAGVQVLCPLLFANGIEWLMSGGVAFGYGLVLVAQLRRRLAERS